MVNDFVSSYRLGEDAELSFFVGAPFELALEYAALAKDERKKRFSHQRRLTRASLSEARSKLFARSAAIQRAKSFAEVLQIVRGVTAKVHGLGELYAYDTALRVSANLGYAPDAVYMHAGTRVGAKRLGVSVGRDFTSISSLPPELQELKAHEVESFLCIYKNQLGAVTRRSA